MDATGRILPCCGGPQPGGSLIFGTSEDLAGDLFNSEKYHAARSFFRGSVPASDASPYCTQCEWEHTTVNIGGPEIQRYFRAADAAFFDARSLRLLGGW